MNTDKYENLLKRKKKANLEKEKNQESFSVDDELELEKKESPNLEKRGEIKIKDGKRAFFKVEFILAELIEIFMN
jgi:hypothetical protein